MKTRRHNKPWDPDQDRFAPDGVICYGNRLVRKGGVVLFGGYKWQHPELEKLIGEYVSCSPVDYYFTAINVGRMNEYPGGMNDICSITHSELSKK